MKGRTPHTGMRRAARGFLLGLLLALSGCYAGASYMEAGVDFSYPYPSSYRYYPYGPYGYPYSYPYAPYYPYYPYYYAPYPFYGWWGFSWHYAPHFHPSPPRPRRLP
ncbi:MAG: hypothetical protein AB1515_01685 [Nitrospirota bacterium]